MANKGRVPPPHLIRAPPGPGAVHPDPYASGIPPPHGGFPHFEMLPPHEVMGQKLSAQHVEIEKLAIENRRLAATHGTLRQDLATASHELQLVHAHINDMNAEKERQIRGLMDRMAMMESELEGAEAIKVELQQARAEAQKLAASRQELMSKVQQLTHDLQVAHSDAQQIPSLMAELDRLRQEHHHCRATYEYEKKLYSDHLESLQVMEKNYMAMSREMEKLQTELTNFGSRAGGPYNASAGYGEHVPLGNYASAQNTYGVGQQGVPVVGMGGPGASGNSPHVAAQSAPYGSGTSHDASRVNAYSASKVPAYDPLRGHAGAGYDAQKGVQTGSSYDPQRGQRGPGPDGHMGSVPYTYGSQMGPGYNPHTGSSATAHNFQTGTGYDMQRAGYNSRIASVYDGQSAPTYDMQRGSVDEAQRGATNYDAQKVPSYNTLSRGAAGPEELVSANHSSYASISSNAAATGYQPAPRSGNPVHK